MLLAEHPEEINGLRLKRLTRLEAVNKQAAELRAHKTNVASHGGKVGGG